MLVSWHLILSNSLSAYNLRVVCQNPFTSTTSFARMSAEKRPRRAKQQSVDDQSAKRKQLGPGLTPSGSVTSEGIHRCMWATQFAGASDPAYVSYHDDEWGRPVKDDQLLYELLVLEGAQAGLSWHTILKKRRAYQRGFCGFDPRRVAQFGEGDVERLMGEDSGIVRHRGKILSAINNARRVLEVQEEFGCFAKFLWGFMPESRPVMNGFTQLQDVPAKTPTSEAMAKELKRRGFSFVGPTTCYSLMQAAGLVNDHQLDCF